MKNLSTRSVLMFLSALSLGTGPLWAQTAPKEAALEEGTVPIENDDKNDEEIIELSPFVVSAEEDTGYLANATALGGRVRTDLKNIASAISVVTQQFLTDTKANDNQSLLKYTTNTEVGGIYGNYAGVGNTFVRGAGESELNMLRPNGNTRVRGLDSADNTRDLVKTDIPWNGFNVGRVDFQRGPNSILFGLGSPAGIINASANTAGYKNGGNVENQIGSFGSMRNSLDYNQVLIPKTLAVRLDAVYDDQKYRQNPAFNRNRSIYGAVRWDPKFFEEALRGRTTIRANYENGKVQANRPHSLPPGDKITPWFDPNALNKRMIDEAIDYQTGLYPWRSGTAAGQPFLQTANNWVGSAPFWGSSPQLFYHNTSTPVRATGSIATQYAPNHSIGGFPFSVPAGVADHGEFASNVIKYGEQNGLPLSYINQFGKAGSDGDKGFWKAQSISDPGIFDFYNNLLSGPTKKEWQNWEAYNFTFEQTFLDDRLGFQATYDRQHYHDGGQSILGWNPTITLDINLYTRDYPSVYSLATRNENAGRPYVAGSGNGQGRWTDRENVIVTGFGEVRASDFLDNDSLLTRILGHHTVSGVYHAEKYQVEDRSWALSAATGVWSDLIGSGYGQSYDGQPGTKAGGLKNGDTVLSHTIYLTGPVTGFPSASQLHLPRIMNNVTSATSLPIRYFDSHWNQPTNPADPNYVDPTAPWTNIGTTEGDGIPKAATQIDNPLNYVGWVTANVPILNADHGDIDELYRSGSKVTKKMTSKGGTWQAYFFDDTIVATYGYRKDRLENRTGQAQPDQTGIAQVHSYDVGPLADTGIDEGSNSSWGVVVRLPKSLRGKLPWGTDVALGYSDGKNTRVENRYGFNANRLPNTKGHTKDISLAVTMLDDRLSFKATHYDTVNKDANISSVGGSAATLGAGTNWVYQIESRGTLSALVDLAGLNGDPRSVGWEWYWNWAWASFDGSPYSVADPMNDAAFNAHPETIKEKAAIQSWLDQMRPQEWFDLYGIDINVAKAKAGDYNTAVRGGLWGPGDYINIGDNGGKINGEFPTGTIDTRSTGWEFEITGKPIKNLDISLNASKQFARQIALGADLVQYMEDSYTKFTSPAGDLRLWWGGDTRFKDVFLGNIWTGYQFQKQTNGKLVNEMSPWRVNLSGTYRFDKGLLKGAFVGGSYRWQQGTILGYRLNETLDNLDIDKPIWGKSEDWVDVWFGYERKLTERIHWRTQVNLRNVGDDPRLRPISVQPDGTPAQQRIEEGMIWTFSNTLSF